MVYSSGTMAGHARLFMVADEGAGRGWGTGDCPPELMLSVSKGLLEVAPSPITAERVVLLIALPERVAPINALALVAPYSTSASPSRSSALNACCTHTHLLHDVLTPVVGREPMCMGVAPQKLHLARQILAKPQQKVFMYAKNKPKCSWADRERQSAQTQTDRQIHTLVHAHSRCLSSTGNSLQGWLMNRHTDVLLLPHHNSLQVDYLRCSAGQQVFPLGRVCQV